VQGEGKQSARKERHKPARGAAATVDMLRRVYEARGVQVAGAGEGDGGVEDGSSKEARGAGGLREGGGRRRRTFTGMENSGSADVYRSAGKSHAFQRNVGKVRRKASKRTVRGSSRTKKLPTKLLGGAN